MAVSVLEAQGLVIKFCRLYPMAAQLTYHIRDTTEGLYSDRGKGMDMLGGYITGPGIHPGRCDIPSGNAKDASDFITTLRHEVIGHFGLNTFTCDQKKALLSSISAARQEPSMRGFWAQVDGHYDKVPESIKAEEVFALYCEGIEPSHHINRESVRARGEQSLQETCIDCSRALRLDDLENITLMVAQGLHDRTRTQQNFPELNQQFREDRQMEPKKLFHEVIAEKLIEQLKQGTAPWQKPWEPGEPNSFIPINPTTGKQYHGINAIQLISQGRKDQRWMTYKQARTVGAQVRNGEKGTPIQYWKFSEEQTKTDESGRPVSDVKGQPVKEEVPLERPRVFFATVFNADQIDGLLPMQPRKEKEQGWNAVERAEHILKASGATIRHDEHNRAFYRSATDSIHLPDKSQFPQADKYYATALHELGHWTGHPSRLNRDLAHPFGSEGYAKEELGAEIASMILGDALGIGHDPVQHVAYVGSWIKAMKEDPLEIFRAAAAAEKIQTYVLTLEQQQVQEQTIPQRQTAVKALAVGVKTEKIVMKKMQAQEQETNMQAPQLGPASYQAEIARLLKISTLTPGRYTPSDQVKADNHAAVFVDVMPAILCGPSADPTSVAQAEALANSPHVQAVFRAAGQSGAMYSGIVAGSYVQWQDTESAVVSKHPGQVETGSDDGPLIAVVLNDPDQALTTSLCVTTAAARIFDPNAPELDDGHNLPALARGDTQINQHEQAVKLARIEEERVRRDPNSTDEDISSAKEVRKSAELAATLNDEDLQRRIAEHEREQQPAMPTAQQPPQQASQGDKTFINVPYKQNDEAKVLGARYDRQEQSWYVPAGVDLTPFAKWSQEVVIAAPAGQTLDAAAQPTAERQRAAQERKYLAVPYGERAAAKAVGVAWDRGAKSWYAGPNADMDKLQRWLPNNVHGEQGPAMKPRDEFADALRSIGCVVSGEHPIMDSKTHRISVEGEKHSEKAGSGFYVGHMDGHPAGYMKNNKTGIDMKWKSKGYALDPEQKAKMQVDAAEKLQARAVEQERLHEQTAQRVGKQMTSLVPVTEPTAYMEAKGIDPQPGVFTDRNGQKTYIPAIDAEGKQWTMQYIKEDGTKRFAKDSRKEGCFHVVRGEDTLAKAPALVICEGYATASSLSQTLGFPTVVSFDSGNLMQVAKTLHEKYPNKPVVIAGDDDKHLEVTQGVNPGRTKAEKVAKAVGGKALFPIFAPGEQSYPSNLEPVTPEKYRNGDLSDDQQAALARMKQFTDFNDLSTKSVLGKEGIERQVRAVVDSVIECHQARNIEEQKQERVQRQEQQPRRAVKI